MTDANVPAIPRKRWLAWVISPLLPILLVVIAATIVRPYANLPLNDDWQYAHIAQHYAESGEIRIDRPIAPALIGQTILGGAFIRIVGFSHSGLRGLTFVLFLLLLAVLDWILRRCEVAVVTRCLALLTLGLNPLAFQTGLSFMTEVYGTLPALLAAVVWLGGDPTRSPSLRRVLIAAVLASVAYLNRQFSGLILPALIGATFVLKWCGYNRDRWLRIWGLAIGAVAILAATVVTHALWSKATLNEPPELASPIKSLLQWKGPAFAIMGGNSLLYLTGFLAPLLCLLPLPPWRRFLSGIVLMALAVATFHFGVDKFLTRHPDGTRTFGSHLPFMTNILGINGIGPLTTTDIYVEKLKVSPHLHKLFWPIVEGALYVLTALWLFVGAGLQRLKELSPQRLGVFATGAFFGVGSLVASLQTYGMDFFDRYLYSSLVGLVIAGAALVPLLASPKPRRWRPIFSVLLLAPIAIFSVGGLHDYFQFQRARWSIYQTLLENGVSPLSIDGGYEPNGWFAYDKWRQHETSSSCVSICACKAKAAWFCKDDSYRISASPRPGDITLDRVFVRTWLQRQYYLLVSRRPDP